MYSREKELAIGKHLAANFEKTVKLVDDAEISSYVDSVGQRLARNSDVRIPVTFRVVDRDSTQAFTLPGGFQYVDRGLLARMESEAELAGVLAHGLAHTAQRSPTKEMIQGQTQTATNGAIVFVPNTSPLTMLKQQREDELAADYFGLQYVYVAGYDPEAYLNLLQRVLPQAPAGTKNADVFSTSPPLSQRIQAMQSEIVAILPKRTDSVASTPEFAEFKDRVRVWKQPSE